MNPPEVERALRERLSNLDKALPLLERKRDSLQREFEQESRDAETRIARLAGELKLLKAKLLAYTKERELVFKQLSGEAA